jgi:L,D-transpeptidase catalytic domain
MQLRILIAGLVLLSAGPAFATQVTVSVNESSQKMTVSVDGRREYVWPVSTGISRYATPTGTYTPFRMEEDHFSEEWDDAPMPHSIFFTRLGHAIHGTEHLASLGHAASHGCVRLSPDNAATLYTLVQAAGMANTTVVVNSSGDQTVSNKPPRRLVEKPPLRLVDNPEQSLVENPPQSLVDNSVQLLGEKSPHRVGDTPRSRRLRRADDPFLDGFN